MKNSFMKTLGASTVLALTIASQDPSIIGNASSAKALVESRHINETNVLQVTPSIVKVSSPIEPPVVKTTDESRYYHVTSEFLNVRVSPNPTSQIEDVLVKNWTVEIVDVTSRGWGKLKTGGYINLKYAMKDSTADGLKTLVKQSRIPKPKPVFAQPNEKNIILAKTKSVSKPVQKQVIIQQRKVETKSIITDRKPVTKETTQSSNSKYDFNAYELDLFARIVQAESGSEPYAGQVAVASVILNRLDSDQFPGTLRSIIYQRKQFSPVMNGSINKKATDSARNAVQDAIKGNGRMYGALYFYAPKYVDSPFMNTRETITQIGGHVFKR